jgi:hypothetical protein
MGETRTAPPPRRYDYRRDMERFPEARIGHRIRVLLNGFEVSKVRRYDVDAGTVVRLQTDALGQVMLNSKRDGVLDQELRGSVKAEWRE